jgi:hypothetical protein
MVEAEALQVVDFFEDQLIVLVIQSPSWRI